jgi:uncharacterized membrane-anchored protein YjiN (DUF445 family)
MTADENDLIQALSALNDLSDDDEGERRLLRFRESLQRMRDDPAEAARIEGIIADLGTDLERDASAEQIWTAPERDWERAEDSA